MDNERKTSNLAPIILISAWSGGGKDLLADKIQEEVSIKRFSFAKDLKDKVSLDYDIPRQWMDDRKMKETPLENFPFYCPKKNGCHLFETLISYFKTLEGASPPKFEPCTDVTSWILAHTNERGIVTLGHKPLYFTPRVLLIYEGSLKRTVVPTYWVDKIKKVDDSNLFEPIVVTDLRFTNEVERCKKIFGNRAIFVRIDVDGEPASNDSSERELDGYRGFDIRFKNDKNGVEKFYGDFKDLFRKKYPEYRLFN